MPRLAFSVKLIITKYYDDRVCVCVSVCSPGYLPNDMFELYQIFVDVAYGRGSVLLGRVTKFQGEGAVLEVYFPTDTALYSITFETHTKLLNRSRCRLGR